MLRYHNITHYDMLNGDGLRVVLWVAGCNHKCIGCHNPETWNINGGIEFGEAEKEEIANDLEKDWCSGITFSGGDPLHPQNRYYIKDLLENFIKPNFPDKTVWIYTGYTWEELRNESSEYMDEILSMTDVLVDGEFDIKKRDLSKYWVGSSNQRVIDVQKSLQNEDIVLYDNI